MVGVAQIEKDVSILSKSLTLSGDGNFAVASTIFVIAFPNIKVDVDKISKNNS